ncbi:hypothetical protein [Pseudoduganella sp. RAF53_2]|uniref:hypothetical protein n=1 Tax=unclassified Pseudoduganella TaxID=2637179 RepID=UPI003F9C596D
MIRMIAARLGALAALVLLVLLALHYPAPKALLGIGLAAYIGVLLYRPEWWLLLVPALLPVLDFAPWTGWFYLEELDMLLLATCVAGYARMGRDKPPTRLPGMAAGALALLMVAVLIGAVRGVLPLAPMDGNAFANYMSPYNGLRVLKGFLWPLALLPLLRHSAGTDGANIRRLFVPGMLLGLCAACLAVIWERNVFPGLFNFASDYRPTAPFSAMHTGGAALDAYLAMAFPFVALWLIGAHHHHARLAAGLICLLLGIFAGFTTFSRDIYLAYAAAGGVIAVLSSAHHVRSGSLRAGTMAAPLLLLALLAFVLVRVFESSGYRGLLACLGLLGAAIVVAGAEPRLRHWLVAIGVAIALLAADGLLQMLASGAATDKNAYMAYLLAGAVCAAGTGLLVFGREEQRPLGLALALGALPAIGVASGMVGYHWSGNAALPDIALVLAVAAALAASRLLPQRLWRLDRGTLTMGFFAAIVFGTLIPIAGSYYTGSRFATVGDDMGVRLTHWSEALDMMDSDGLTQAFGQGLGRYPETYLWKNTHGEMPGTFRYEEENGNNRFLRFGATQFSLGYGEVLRMLQHVDVQAGKHYELSVDTRRPNKTIQLRALVCERWLIYPQNCTPIRFPEQQKQWKEGWEHNSSVVTIEAGSRGPFGPPIQLELSSDAGGLLDIDNVSLRELDTGRELIRNGNFSDANDYWFFSSDRNHMPFHVKNFAVNQVFELGWIGAVVTAFFLIAVGAPLVARGLGGDLQAAVFLAAMTGCMMVGLFDSITDVPRLTILFMLLALAGNLKAVAPKRKRRRRSGSSESQEAEALIA